MGRGNFLPKSGVYTDYYMYYINYEAVYGKNYLKNESYGSFEWGYLREDFINQIREKFKNRFDSFVNEGNFRANNMKVIAANYLCEMFIADNQTSLVIGIGAIDDELAGLGWKHLQEYRDGLLEILKDFAKGYVSVRSGTWTSSKLDLANL